MMPEQIPPLDSDTEAANAGLRKALKSALAHARIQRSRGRTGKSTATVAKVKRKPKKKPPKIKRGSVGLTPAEQHQVDDLVSAETQAHGIYEPVDFKVVETVQEGGKVKQHTSNVVMNRGGTAVERWHRNGRLDRRQLDAITVYQGAYMVWHQLPRVVANWDALISRQAGAAIEMHAATRMRARQLLRLFDQDIFFRRGVDDFNVWQNVVIHDEPAGVAGSRLGFTSKQAEAAAAVVVGGIAHEIASLVIDQSPPDLNQLLLDIDAPRKPRGVPKMRRT